MINKKQIVWEQSKLNREKDLTKNTIIITIGKVSTQFVSFLLLPLYTALLTTKEYGTIDLIITLVQLIIPISSLMIDQAVFRFLLIDETDNGKKKVITSAFMVLLCISVITIVLYFLLAVFVENDYKIWLLLILIVTAFSNLFLQIARGLKHVGDYALGSFVCSTSTIILNVICVVSLQMGALGMLIATFAGNFICCCFLFIKLKIGSFLSITSISKANAVEQLKYSIPLVPNQLSLWIINSSDRLIVSFFLGTAANGILAVSHKFPSLYMTFFNIFQLSWHQTGAVHYFDEDRDIFFSSIIKKMLSVFSTLCLAIIVVLPMVFNWFVNSSYNEAYYNIPIYMVAFLFNIVIGLLGAVYVATKKTAEMAKTTMIAAGLNIIVNIALIKYLGLYAASISTFVSYLVTMIYRIIDTKKYLEIKYDIKQFIVIGIASVVCCCIYYLNNKVISIIFFPVFLMYAYLINKELIYSIIKIGIDKIGKKYIKKYKTKIIVLSVVIALVCVGIGGANMCKNIHNRSIAIQDSYTEKVASVNPVESVLFSQFGMEDFTCTGLAYDSLENSFWIADYGALSPSESPNPRVVEVNSDFTTVIKIIDLSNVFDKNVNFQGLCYDISDDAIWGAIGNSIVEFDKTGSIINTIELDEYAKYLSNGICYDAGDDTIWVLCASNYILHYSKNGSVIETIDFNFTNQDHIVKQNKDLLITVGADYSGINNYVCRFSCDEGRIKKLYRLSGSNAVEGICINDGKIFIANDGAYHSDLKSESYISLYNESEFN